LEGIEFRSMTLRAFKACPVVNRGRQQAILYKGPWRSVVDDAGETLLRGQRVSVGETEFARYTRPPYADQIEAVKPQGGADPANSLPLACCPDADRERDEESPGSPGDCC
jgi:hypothetical protein